MTNPASPALLGNQSFLTAAGSEVSVIDQASFGALMLSTITTAIAGFGGYSLESIILFTPAYVSPDSHIADAPTNAPDNSPTNLNVLTTLLGSLVGQVNSTNANQNQIADNLNATAAKLNLVLAALEAHGILA